MVSHRPKHPKDLADKLRLKSKTKPQLYSWDGLREDLGQVVTDLAGCRVVVYTPDDEHAVGGLVPGIFSQPSRPDAPPVRRRGVSEVYWATHALVFPYSAGEEPDPTIEGAICELQIVTVAAHLFNEIEHDISYKERDAGITIDDGEKELLHEIRGVARVADRLVAELISYRGKRRDDAQRLIEDPEELKFALWAHAGRRVDGTELGRLLGLLEQCLATVTPAAIQQFGSIEDLINSGRALLGTNAGEFDELVLYAVGLMNQFGPEIRAASRGWRGPRTSLRRAIDLVPETAVGQAGATS